MKQLLLSFYLLLLTLAGKAQAFMPDSSFGKNGIVTSPEDTQHCFIYDIAFQPDKKIVAVGIIYHRDIYHSYLVRYLHNGKVDSSFGKHGRVITDIGTNDEGRSVVLQPDGKIVIAGNETVIIPTPGGVSIITRPYMARFHATGKPDSSFATNGVLKTSVVDAYVNSIVLRADGTLIAGGSVRSLSLQQFMLLAVLPDGTYNTAFGTGGKAVFTVEAGKDAAMYDMVMQPDEKIVMTGYTGLASLVMPPDTRIGLARFHTNGSPDSSFGLYGAVATQLSTSANPFDIGSKIRLQKDGKLVVAGGSDTHLAIARYLADGKLDNTFGTAGTAHHKDIPSADGLYITDKEQLLVSGLIVYTAPYTTDISISRIHADGSLDGSFGTAGMLQVDLSSRDQAYTLNATADDAVYVGGHSADVASGNVCFTLLRYTDKPTGTAIPETDQPAARVSLFPNPADGLLHLSVDGLWKGTAAVANIVNMIGQVQQVHTVNNGLNTIDISNLPAGIYQMQLGSGDHTTRLRFVKK